jgi:hypothetical protein
MRRTLSTQYRPVRLRLLARLLAFGIGVSALWFGVLNHTGSTASRAGGPAFCRSASGPAQTAGGTFGTVIGPSCFQHAARFDRSGLTPGTILMRDARPLPGEPCRNLYAHAADVVTGPDGIAAAVFTFAGGAATGRLPFSAEEVQLAATRQPYMTDVQLGSYEPAGRSGVLSCQLNPTFHFYCPTTNALDSLCLVWVDRRPS